MSSSATTRGIPRRLIPPQGTPERLRYTYWLHYAEGSAMPPLLLKLVFDRIETSPMPFFVKPVARGIAGKVKATFIAPQLKTHLDYMEAELGKAQWFAGETFTAADIQMSFPLEAAKSRAGLDASRPKLLAFLVGSTPGTPTSARSNGAESTIVVSFSEP